MIDFAPAQRLDTHVDQTKAKTSPQSGVVADVGLLEDSRAVEGDNVDYCQVIKGS